MDELITIIRTLISNRMKERMTSPDEIKMDWVNLNQMVPKEASQATYCFIFKARAKDGLKYLTELRAWLYPGTAIEPTEDFMENEPGSMYIFWKERQR